MLVILCAQVVNNVPIAFDFDQLLRLLLTKLQLCFVLRAQFSLKALRSCQDVLYGVVCFARRKCVWSSMLPVAIRGTAECSWGLHLSSHLRSKKKLSLAPTAMTCRLGCCLLEDRDSVALYSPFIKLLIKLRSMSRFISHDVL